VAAEVARLIAHGQVRDRDGMRSVRPDDVAILFRARTGHQFFESALEARGIRTYVYKGLGFFDAPEVQDLQALLRYLAQPDSNLRAAELLRSRLVRISDEGLARLAQGGGDEAAAPGEAGGPLANALRLPSIDLDAFGLDEIDRGLLEAARASLTVWLRLRDRISPSELVDEILRDSAYTFELRGRRGSQARENLKKVRSLIRRIENRGYATLGRIAEYFETLRAGDESHAVIEAAGCVNLMTVHAAKGLERPIVFLVNLHVPGRGRSSAFTVIEHGADGTPEVAFGPTEGTKREDLREREELRRLLYVAITRARDRLYLVSEIDDSGRLRRGARSLAALLPATLGDVFTLAAGGDQVEWASPSGRFAFRVCRPDDVETTPDAEGTPLSGTPDVEPIVATDPGITAAAASGEPRAASAPRVETALEASERLLGTVVHRLFQRQPAGTLTHAEIAALVPHLIRPEEAVDVADLADLSRTAARFYDRLRSRGDLAALLGQGACHYEVPFSFHAPGSPRAVVRGRIDCLVAHDDGRLTIVELKTGRPRPEHQAQVDLYQAALSAAAPGVPVDIRLIYASER
jgi:ATP-dependent exoDNAse (exonuclease V) beta subunit